MRRIFIAIAGLFFGMTLLVIVAGRADDSASILPPFAVFTIWCLVLWGLPRWAARKQFRGQPSAQGPITLTLDETGVHWQWNGGSASVEWKNIVRSVEGKGLILLYTSPVIFNIVPKRSLKPAELNTLRALVSKKGV